MRLGPALVFATFLLVVWGAVFYVDGAVGWAQFFWVLASGTAGAGIVAWVDGWRDSRPGRGVKMCPYRWSGTRDAPHIHGCTVRAWAQPHTHLCGCGATKEDA